MLREVSFSGMFNLINVYFYRCNVWVRIEIATENDFFFFFCIKSKSWMNRAISGLFNVFIFDAINSVSKVYQIQNKNSHIIRPLIKLSIFYSW